MNTNAHFHDIFLKALTPKNDGTQGRFRADPSKLMTSIDNDSAAINIYLEQNIKNEGTRRMYFRELERLQMWAVMVCDKSIADLEMADFHNYVKFLKTPRPGWVADKKYLRGSVSWRPFVREKTDKGKPFELSENALNNAVSALNAFMVWLVHAGYLSGNTLGLIRKKIKAGTKKDSHEVKVDRFIRDETVEDIKHVILNWKIECPMDRVYQERARFIFTFFIMLGARISELSNARMRDFEKKPTGWFWNVIGKGNKEGSVAVPEDMMIALSRWRKVLGLSAYPRDTELSPVVPKYSKHQKPLLHLEGLSPRRINQILDEVFNNAIEYIRVTYSVDEAESRISELENASAHWLRHTSITQKVSVGMDFKAVQKDARHKDSRTTDQYDHSDSAIRVREVKKHKMTW